MKQLPTVTIAVCAYNEEHNIGDFLTSVLVQKQKGFILNSITVISDGSSDKTVEVVEKKKAKKITIVAHKTRKGKSTRLNELYKNLTSDILVQTDADVIFSHDLVVSDMVKALTTSTSMMCGGNPLPLKGVTFIEKAINQTTKPYLLFRRHVRNGSNVFSADGRLLGFKKEFISAVRIPTTMIANDMFAYFCCKTKGFDYSYVPSAVVWYRSPQTIKDHIRQNTRFVAGPRRMERYFSPKLVKQETTIPSILYIKALAQYFLSNPLLSGYIVFLNLYCRVNALLVEKKLLAAWQIAHSTKILRLL